MKVKFFSAEDSTVGWEEEINEFIQDKKVKDMQMTTTRSEEWGEYYNLVILYE